jgi:hypothetical protein
MSTVVFLTLIVILLLVYYYRNYAGKGEDFYPTCPCDPRFEITEQGLYEGNVLDHLAPGALNPYMFPYSAYPCVYSVRDAYKGDFDRVKKFHEDRAKSETDEAKKLKEMSNNSTTDHAELVD